MAVTVTPQKIDNIYITKLKGLRNANISFGEKPITAIFGKNGSGKSTILHALACLYRPLSNKGEMNYFTRFFKRENSNYWQGSEITASFTVNGQSIKRNYGKRGNRWSPRTENRPQRDVIYMGISSCVPDIEQVSPTLTSLSMGNETEIHDKEKIIQDASYILGFEYQNYSRVPFFKKSYKRATVAEYSYSSLSMGAGEQRLFTILEVLYSMPAYSLLLIDELDLTLHSSALNRLLDKMNKVAENRHLQIVFTTHREELTLRNDINIRHIWKTATEPTTFVLNHTTPDCLQRLTGKIQKPLEVFVEDELAEYIARQVAKDKGLLKYTSFFRFGCIDNAFVVAAGCDIQESDSDNRIIITDGDKYRTEEERTKMMNATYSGNEVDRSNRRARALSHIKQYILPKDEQPEHYLWTQLKNTENEYATIARNVPIVQEDKHAYLYDVQKESGDSREAFLTNVLKILSEQPFWKNYVSELSHWLDERKQELT